MATDYRPFCSKRCQEHDLGNWLDGSYAIPATDPERPPPDSGDGETLV